MLNKIEISIIIVNYNGELFLKECLLSIRKFISINFEVIIVDNASNDNSIVLIKDDFPWVKLICINENLGFVQGNNLARSFASGEYLLLLNNDTVITSRIDSLITTISNDITIGAIGCRLIFGDGSQQESIGKELTPWVLALSWTPLVFFQRFRRAVFAQSDLYGKSYQECEWISGAFLITRLSTWDELNGLDSSYFMYMEDVDYCKRLRILNYKIIYSSSATVIHYEGAGKAWIGLNALINTSKSYLTYCKKYYRKSDQVFSIVMFIIFQLRSIAHLLKFLITFNQTELKKSIDFNKSSFIFFGV